jgi:hypothetical protein
MAVAYRSISVAVAVASGTLTLTEPTGATTDDLLIACIGYRGTSSTAPTLPAGWLQIEKVFVSNTATNNNARPSLLMAWIKRGASAPSFAFTNFNNAAIGYVVRIDGHDSLSPTDGSTSLLSDSVIATHSTGSITPTRDDGLLLAMACAGVEGTNGSAWSTHQATIGASVETMTEIGDASTTLGADVDIAVAYITAAQMTTSNPLQESSYSATHDRASRSSLGLVAIKPPQEVTATSRSFAVIC